jgi:hypothetical protein
VPVSHLDSQRSLPVIGADKSGFSPLAKKLRLAAEHSVLVLNAPDGYVAKLEPGPSGIRTEPQPSRAHDVVLLFVRDVEQLRRLGSPAIHAVKPDGLLWIAHPKDGASDLPPTPSWLQRDVLGEITSERGYKPVAFVAVDETWTALRFKKV